ncbi:MAG: DUF4097 domain-containing protein [Acidobacteriia bacterium]|nr:DUF4097 domain-containing protein [Terriglobia bacterium]
MQRTAVAGLVLAMCLASVAIAESRKEYRYNVGPQANVSVDAQYGAVSVKPGSANQVLITAIAKGDKVDVESQQNGNRVEVGSRLRPGADPQSGRVDYELSVPPDATVHLRSSTGPITADGLQGDVTLEGAGAQVEARNLNRGHLVVQTMSGPITLNNVHNGHVEITSISGDIHLNSVTAQLVKVESTNGRIFYSGDFGSGGDYRFSTHTGDIEALVPASASAEFSAQSLQGQVQNDFPLQPKQHSHISLDATRAFIGTAGKAASAVVMRSFSGKIRLKQR